MKTTTRLLIPRKQFICDHCGEIIRSPEEGMLEWKCPGDSRGQYAFRIVHHVSYSPLGRPDGCYAYAVNFDPLGLGQSCHLHHVTDVADSDGYYRYLADLAGGGKGTPDSLRVNPIHWAEISKRIQAGDLPVAIRD